MHGAMTLFIAVFSFLRGSPPMSVALRALSQAFLIHSLWKGSRFSQWMHVLGCFGWAVLAIALGAKRPSPVMWGICGGIAGFWLWLAWLFGFSPSVRAFLAYQRGELAETPDIDQPLERPAPVDGEESLQPQTRVESPWPESGGLVSCDRCDARMKSFVVVCPTCGARRRTE